MSGKISNTNCCVYGCNSRKIVDPSISFHKFPKPKCDTVAIVNRLGVLETVDRCKAWEIKLLIGTPVTSRLLVCSLHFLKEDYYLPDMPSCRPRLRSIAVPSQNLPQKNDYWKKLEHQRNPRYQQQNENITSPCETPATVILTSLDNIQQEGSELNQEAPSPSYVKHLNEIKQESPHDCQLKLLQHKKPTIKSETSLSAPEPEGISHPSLELKLEPPDQDCDENDSIKKELLHEEVDIKNENETIEEPCLNASGLSSQVKPFKCNSCDYSCGRKTDFQKHLITHTGEKAFECNICGNCFGRKTALQRHLLSHVGDKPVKCNMCDYSCRHNSALMEHLKTHTGEKSFKCYNCDYSCSRKRNLKLHIKIHAEEKPFKCTICDFSCRLKSALKMHVRTHNPKKCFQCNFCGYSYSQKCYLNTHLRIHTGEKPFKCYICDYRCGQKGSLARHFQTHTGEKPFKCHICNYSGSRASVLKRHMRTHSKVHESIK